MFFHAHLALGAVAVERKPVDQAHRFGVERVYLSFFLTFALPLLGRDDTVADGRQRTFQKPCRAFSFKHDDVLAFSLD